MWRNALRELKRSRVVEVIHGARTNKVHGLYLLYGDSSNNVLHMISPLSEIDTSARTVYVGVDSQIQPKSINELVKWVEAKVEKSNKDFMNQELGTVERPFTDLQDLVLHVDLKDSHEIL